MEKELMLKEKEMSAGDSLNQIEAQILNTKNNQNQANAVTKNQGINNDGEKFIGLWKYNNDAFLKITKDKSGKFKFQSGYNYENNDENSISWETDDNVYPKLSNGKMQGKYRIWEGSAADAYSDIKFSIEFKTNNKLLFKTNVRTGGGGAAYSESFEAIKIK